MPNPSHHRYLVTRQGNRNLALDAADAEFRDTPEEAAEKAHKQARYTKDPHYVYEVTVKIVRSSIPMVTVKDHDYED